MSRLEGVHAERFARTALGHVAREYPSSLALTLHGPEDLGAPRDLHPIFFGSFDWHSCVHGHWLLARLLRTAPLPDDLAEAIRAHFATSFTPKTGAGELAYFQRRGSGGFERPYGWAWLLMLDAELARHGAAASAWRAALAPLTALLASRLGGFLGKLDYPVRAGTHASTAFAMILALHWSRQCAERPLEALIVEKALAWHREDVEARPFEPSGEDFLSPTLVTALLMKRVLSPGEFRVWFDRCLPGAGEGEPASLFQPARVSDRTDGRIAHLDGLNLSRAWCWRSIAHASGERLAQRAQRAAEVHLDASLAAVSGDYMGEHWLASFALLALDGEDV